MRLGHCRNGRRRVRPGLVVSIYLSGTLTLSITIGCFSDEKRRETLNRYATIIEGLRKKG